MSDAANLVMMARITGSLVVVLVVVVLAARLARRLQTRGGRATTLAVRERVGLTRDTAAVVLEAGDRLLLLGVSPSQVCVLADLGAGPTLVAAPAASPDGVRVVTGVPSVPQLTRRELREATGTRRTALPAQRGPAARGPATQRGTGAALDPRTWQQGLEALRDLTARRG